MSESNDTEERYTGWLYENRTRYGYVKYVLLTDEAYKRLDVEDARIDVARGYGVEGSGFEPVTFTVERRNGDLTATNIRYTDSE